jgi:hypothetical protein
LFPAVLEAGKFNIKVLASGEGLPDMEGGIIWQERKPVRSDF